MSGMLQMEPADRLSALECLADPYFDGLRDPEVDRMVVGLKQQNQL